MADAGFAQRHIGPNDDEQAAMLAELGYDSLATLIDAAVPAVIRDRDPLALDAPASEGDALARLRTLAARNEVCTSLLGLGYHDTITPPVIQRNVLENPGVVHGVHAVPARDQPGPARGAHQLPDDGQRSHRHGARERVAARRRHRRGRGDDDAAPSQRHRWQGRVPGRPRLSPADDRRRTHSRRAARHPRRGRRALRRVHGRRLLRRARAVSGHQWPAARCPAGHRAGARRTARSCVSRPTCSRSRS